MMMNVNGYLYQKIVDDASYRLGCGEFKSGDRLYSVNEMQEHYDVSSTTAVRAIEELKRMGLVESIRGKGTFFKGISSHEVKKTSSLPKLNKITLLVSTSTYFKSGFQIEIYAGIEAEVEKAGLLLDIKKIPSENPSQTNQMIYEPAPDEGILLIASKIPVRVYPLLMAMGVRAVLIDSFVPGVPSVCTDNYDGINQIVNHCVDLGHRHICLAHSFPASPNHFNESERLAAFKFIAENSDLTTEVYVSSEQDQIFKHLKSKKGSTAVIFTQDLAAWEFMDFIKNKRVKIPADFSICGFDGWTHDSERSGDFTTFVVDRDKIGKEAVKVILDEKIMEGLVKPAIRIKGNLRVGGSTSQKRA